MNYLAHAYLSFGNDPVLIGNIISDFVKGKRKFNYPADIQKGIMLHRMIDGFTDAHLATKNAKKIFKSSADAYAPVFVDVIYDHFLAVDETEFPLNKLEFFASETYHVLKQHQQLLPEKFSNMLPYMINQNWFLNYRFNWGVENSFCSILVTFLSRRYACVCLLEHLPNCRKMKGILPSDSIEPQICRLSRLL